MNIRPYRNHLPRLGANVYIDPAAVVIGDVELGEDASLWPFTVARGDVNFIRIGARTNVQDGSVLHVTHDGPYTPGGFPLLIGADVTIGHAAVLHACTIEDACLIGMRATILDGAVVRTHAMVGAGALSLDAALGIEVERAADRSDAAAGDRHVGALVTARGRVDHAAVVDQQLHLPRELLMPRCRR